MRKVFLIASVFGLMSCTTSQQYDENVRGIISFALDDSLYKLTTEHLVCFTCETGLSPNSVAELIAFEPAVEKCKSIFRNQEFDFLDQRTNGYKITTKRWEDRTSFVFTSEGLSFDESGKSNAPSSLTMNVYDNEVDCPHNKSIMKDIAQKQRDASY
jgi:hypothetical protein